VQYLLNDLRGSAKNACYERRGVLGGEKAFHSIQGRAV